MQDQINQLKNKVSELEIMIKGRSPQFEEKIRDITFFDIDNSTVTTTTLNVPVGGGAFTIPKNPNTYIKIRFRGKVYEIPVFLPS